MYVVYYIVIMCGFLYRGYYEILEIYKTYLGTLFIIDEIAQA